MILMAVGFKQYGISIPTRGPWLHHNTVNKQKQYHVCIEETSCTRLQHFTATISKTNSLYKTATNPLESSVP